MNVPPPCAPATCAPPAYAAALTLVTVCATPDAGVAQAAGAVHVEMGTATALPAAAVAGDAAVYGMSGLSLDWTGDRTDLSAGLHGGLALDPERGGDFASAVVRAQAWSGGGDGVAVGVVARAYGFTVGKPFAHRNGTLLAGPGVRWSGPGASVALRAEGGSGASVLEVGRRTDRPVRRLDRHLWSVGGVVETAAALGRARVSAEAGSWRSAGGPFRSATVAVTGGAARWAVRGEVGWWETPGGEEWVGGVAVVVPLGGRWSVQGVGGRAGPDPLTLVAAGDQGGVMVTWRVSEWTGGEVAPLYEATSRSEEGAVVSFRLERAGAERVDLLGDFTDWEPRAMRGDGGTWTLEVTVPEGVHHFGFRVDGDWFVPEGHPGNVPDEWGRTNATLVVPPASGEES